MANKFNVWSLTSFQIFSSIQQDIVSASTDMTHKCNRQPSFGSFISCYLAKQAMKCTQRIISDRCRFLHAISKSSLSNEPWTKSCMAEAIALTFYSKFWEFDSCVFTDEFYRAGRWTTIDFSSTPERYILVFCRLVATLFSCGVKKSSYATPPFCLAILSFACLFISDFVLSSESICAN